MRIVHEAGGLCFYDHANFNGVMGKIRARELGFDACMFMLHKTFGAPKGGGGPAVGAYGCTARLAPFLPKPVVVKDDGKSYRLDYGREAERRQGPRILRQCAAGAQGLCLAPSPWARDGIDEASDISVLANNYMDHEAREDPRPLALQPADRSIALEMTRWSLGKLEDDTGVGTVDVAEPHGRLRRRPLLDEPRALGRAGALHAGSGRDVFQGRSRLLDRRDRQGLGGGLCRSGTGESAPHNQAIHQIKGAPLDDPAKWAMTWRAYLRKRAKAQG